MLKELIKIANELDNRGLVKEASKLDDIIQALGLGKEDLVAFRDMISKDIDAFKEWLNVDDRHLDDRPFESELLLPDERSPDEAWAAGRAAERQSEQAQREETDAQRGQSPRAQWMRGEIDSDEANRLLEEEPKAEGQEASAGSTGDAGPVPETAKELARDGAIETLFNLFF